MPCAPLYIVLTPTFFLPDHWLICSTCSPTKTLHLSPRSSFSLKLDRLRLQISSHLYAISCPRFCHFSCWLHRPVALPNSCTIWLSHIMNQARRLDAEVHSNVFSKSPQVRTRHRQQLTFSLMSAYDKTALFAWVLRHVPANATMLIDYAIPSHKHDGFDSSMR